MDGTIFDIQRFSIYDGPGIRTNVFFKGCPLRCLWCHNPESQSAKPELMFYENKCAGCGRCAQVCGKTHTPECTACGKCVGVCLHGAREISGRTVSADDVFKEVLRDECYYKTSGGGVTLSGGEPLMQPDLALELLRKCKAAGIHTAVETCGYVSREALSSVLPFTDLFLCDIKGIDGELHRKNTGVSNERILDNAEFLKKNAASVIFRMPYIPGANDGELSAVREFTKGFPLEIMGYHRLGENKYRALGRDYVFEGMENLDKSVLRELSEKYGTCNVF